MTLPSSLQWLSLVGVIWLQTVNGPNSDFAVYSSQLKHILSISQVQLNNLAFASDAGKLLGWFSGIAAIYLPLRVVLLAGASLGLVGYGVQYLFLAKIITSISYWQVFVLTAVAGNGICWINTVCYLVCIRNFPSDSRIAVGLSTSYVALSARVYTAVVDVFFDAEPGRKAKAYLLLNAAVPMLVAVATFPLLRVVETRSVGMRYGSEFLGMIVITLATGVCAVVGSIGSGGLWEISHIVSLGTLLFAPLLVPVVVAFRDGMEERTRSMKQRKVHVIITSGEVQSGDKVDAELAEEKEVPFEVLWSSERKEKEKEEEEVEVLARGEGKGEVGFSMLIRMVNFWLYFFTYMFGSTVGLVFLNNLGQIAESHGLAKTSTLVSLASSFGFFGRLIPSLMDHFFSKNGYIVSGPAFMTIIMTPMTGAFFLLLHSNTLFLHVGTAIIGACSGAIASIAVSTTPELFGAKNFAVNHNIVVTNIPIGSFLFGYLAAFLYQREAGGSESCMGPVCYQNTFIIWGSICAFGTLLSAALYFRTKMFTSEETCNNPNTDQLSVVV